MSEKWNVTWNSVYFSVTDSQRRTSADISQGWHCFKTSNCDTCQPQSYTQSTLPTHTHTQTHTHWSSTSIAIIHQIYLHWSRTKIKPTPPLPTHLTRSFQAKSNHSSILAVIDWLPIQLNFSQMEMRRGEAALLKAIRHWHWQKGWRVGGGWTKWGDRREMAREEK